MIIFLMEILGLSVIPQGIQLFTLPKLVIGGNQAICVVKDLGDMTNEMVDEMNLRLLNMTMIIYIITWYFRYLPEIQTQKNTSKN